ncbi:MAG: CARDB domain-containing protein, partial [Candidatus Njordarchaeum guaymaensis]
MKNRAKSLILASLMLMAMIAPFVNPRVSYIINAQSIKNMTNNNDMLGFSVQQVNVVNSTGFTVAVLAHKNNYYSTRVNAFLGDILTELGANLIFITPNNDSELYTLLNGHPELVHMADAIVLLNPADSNFTDEEDLAYLQFLEDSKGILILGDYYSFLYPDRLNPLTAPYGIYWLDDSVMDDTNNGYNEYYPLIHVWENNSVAKYVSNTGTIQVKYSGTCLNVTGVNDSQKTIYIIGIGDNDTYTKYNSANAENITVFAAVETNTGGKLFLSGSTYLFSDRYGTYTSYNNSYFAMQVLRWLLEDIKLMVYSYAAPDTLIVGKEAYVNVTIKNLDSTTAAQNVRVTFQKTGGAYDILNSSTEFNLGNLNPGESKVVSLHIKATDTSTAYLKVTVESDNLGKHIRTIPFETLGLGLELSLTQKTLLYKF